MMENLDVIANRIMEKLSEDETLIRVNKWLLMYFAGTTRYEIINPVIEFLIYKGILAREGNHFVVVPRLNIQSEDEKGDSAKDKSKMKVE